MTSILTADYLRINHTVIPAVYMPDWIDGVEPAEDSGETNLYGARVGGRGGGTCVMGWEICPEDVYKWWFNEFWGPDRFSIAATDLVLPDPAGLGTAYLPERYLNSTMGRFNWGVAHRITRSGGQRRHYELGARRRPFLLGATITITMIGSVPPL